MKNAKRVLLIITLLHIPAGLLFYYGYVNSLVSYKYEVQDSEYSYKLETGNWTERDLEIIDDIDFCASAARYTLYSFVILGFTRIAFTFFNQGKSNLTIET